MSDLRYASTSEIDETYDRLQKTYKDGATFPLEYRRKQLFQLARLAQENATAIEDALYSDLGKPRHEGIFETAMVIMGALEAAQRLEQWAAPEAIKVEDWRSSWETMRYSVPKGVALIIAPWNFPFTLSLSPLVGAIAAGCPAVVKPSEHAPACATLMARLIAKYLDPAAYAVINGAVEETTTLLSHRWDHIFFSGSERVGRIIAKAAAEKLTPVTLELGGKNPVIVDETCDLELAAKRILWAKTQNCGQLCVTVDHVYVPRRIVPAFTEALRKAYDTFWPTSPLHPDMKWGRIVSPSHFTRVKGLLDRTQGSIILGGENDSDRRIAPTLVSNVKPDDSLMEEEIFGPVLPLVEVEDADEAITFISQRPSPLVIYAFTTDECLKEKLLKRTRSGTIFFNDVASQGLMSELPFGGFGESGFGSYLGKASFDTFTHKRGFLNVPSSAESVPWFAARYRPYTDDSYNIVSGVLQIDIPNV